MEEQDKETKEKKPVTKIILYGVLVIVVALVVVVLVAKYAFNVDLLNFEEVSGMMNQWSLYARRAR